MEVDPAPPAIPRKCFEIIRTLGEGAFGEVKLVVDIKNPSCALAMKCLSLNSENNLLKEFKKEALIQRKLSEEGHENVIRFIGMRTDQCLKEFQIFLEYADGGELFDQIEPDVGLPIKRAQYFFLQLLDGLSYIHSHGVAHRDIKPENLLLTKRDILKISDFGMATLFRHAGDERLLTSSCGTLPYVAPEVLTKAYRAEPADIWSCGIVLVTMLAGELPWEAPRTCHSAFTGWMSSSSLSMNPWKKLDNNALSLLRIILTDKVDNRADMARIKKHPWCTQFVANCEPSAKRRKILSTIQMDKEAASQPVADREPLPSLDNSFVSNSFSQPEDIDSLLLSNSQISDSSQILNNPFQSMVRRMTRFVVTESREDIVKRIFAACDKCGFVAKDRPPCQIHVTYREISFIISIIDMPENGIPKILIDVRRSRGDGLEFKRAYLMLRLRLNEFICNSGNEWLASQGLVASPMAEVVY